MTKRSIIKALTIVPSLSEIERIEFLRTLGFVPYKVRNKYCEIYKNEDLQMIVKNGSFLGRAPRQLKVSTVLLNGDRRTSPKEDRTWVRQPLVNTENSLVALKQINTCLSKRKRRSYVDIHRWNVGHIKKNGRWKAVIFDW